MVVVRALSLVTVVCAGLIVVWGATSLLSGGQIEIGGSPWFEWLAVFPGIIGLVLAMALAVVTVALAMLRRLRGPGSILIVAGHLLTVVLVGLCVLAVSAPGASGWELVLLGPALVVGQVLVAAGLLRGAMIRPVPTPS